MSFIMILFELNVSGTGNIFLTTLMILYIIFVTVDEKIKRNCFLAICMMCVMKSRQTYINYLDFRRILTGICL